MSNVAVVNNLRQAIPILTLVPPTADPELTILLSRQRIVIDASGVGQDLTDKQSAGYVAIASTTDTLSDGFEAFS